jgi:hypothetical protein
VQLFLRRDLGGVIPRRNEALLNDPRAAAFNESFTGQWLDLPVLSRASSLLAVADSTSRLQSAAFES